MELTATFTSLGGPDPCDFQRQVAGATQDRAAPVRGRVLEQARILKAAYQLCQRDLCLDPGERCAEAAMNAAAEAEVQVPRQTRGRAAAMADFGRYFSGSP